MGPHAHECVRACVRPGPSAGHGRLAWFRPCALPGWAHLAFPVSTVKSGEWKFGSFWFLLAQLIVGGGRWAHLLVQNLGPLQAVPGQDLLAAGHVHLHPRGGGRRPPWALRAPLSDEAAGGSAPFSPGDEQRRFRGWGGPARLLPLLPLPFRPLPAGLRRRPAWPALSVPGLAGAGREGWLTRGKARGHGSREP